MNSHRCEQNGAGNGTRTREYKLGKLVPYHLATPAFLIFKQAKNLVRLAGLEPAAYGLEVRCSIH